MNTLKTLVYLEERFQHFKEIKIFSN